MTIKYDETMDPEVAASLGDISNLGTVAMPPTLMRGSKGAAVTALQKFLNSFGYGIKVDGDFGPETEAAVKVAQSKLKRPMTGRWTPEDDAALKAVNQSGIVDATPSDKAAITKAAVVAQTPPAVITQPGAQPAQPPAQPGQEVAPQDGDFMAKLKVWMQSPWYWVGIAGVGVGLWWLWKQSKSSGGAQQVAAVETLALEDGLNGMKSKPKRKKRKAKAKKKAPAKKAEPEADEEE